MMINQPTIDWWQQPRVQRFAGNALQDLGVGLARGVNVGEGLGIAAQRGAAMQGDRNAYEEQLRQEQAQREQENLTRQWVAQNAPEYLGAIDAGVATAADVWAQKNAGQPERQTTTINNRLVDTQTGQVIGDYSTPASPENAGTGGFDFDIESKLRKEYQSGQGFKDFTAQERSYQRVLDSASDPSPAGDLALIFNYMKILDPGSVVRESEFATAAASGSLGERWIAIGQKLLNGERLSPAMRRDFVNRAGELFQGSSELFGRLNNRYNDLSGQYGIDPSRITRPPSPIGVLSPDWNIDQFMGGNVTPNTPPPVIRPQTQQLTTSTGIPWSVE